jgi:hypothetical protein
MPVGRRVAGEEPRDLHLHPPRLFQLVLDGLSVQPRDFVSQLRQLAADVRQRLAQFLDFVTQLLLEFGAARS